LVEADGEEPTSSGEVHGIETNSLAVRVELAVERTLLESELFRAVVGVAPV
jgi:hypothetical protein